MLPVVQGRIGLVNAIRDLTMIGYTISLPLIDNQPYDLVVDINEKLYKVSVKSTRVLRNGYPVVQIGETRSNKKVNVIKKFDPLKVDYLYVYSLEKGSWMIPSLSINRGRCLTLGDNFSVFKINSPNGDADFFPFWDILNQRKTNSTGVEARLESVA